MTQFRPCIDLHEGVVKQIVGGTLDAVEGAAPETNFVSQRSAGWYAEKYREDGLAGGHVIKLGPGNDDAAREALAAWPGGLQLGGGITAENAAQWLEAGAKQVIVTSYLFDAQSARFREDRLEKLVAEVGAEKLVIDLSCRRRQATVAEESDAAGEDSSGFFPRWVVAMNRWQTLTNIDVTPATLDALSGSCAEFLVHAADVEGRCEGIDSELVELLGSWARRPMTYAGGAQSLDDLKTVDVLSGGHVDLTIGSALDIFGGGLVKYADCVKFNRDRDGQPQGGH